METTWREQQPFKVQVKLPRLKFPEPRRHSMSQKSAGVSPSQQGQATIPAVFAAAGTSLRVVTTNINSPGVAAMPRSRSKQASSSEEEGFPVDDDDDDDISWNRKQPAKRKQPTGHSFETEDSMKDSSSHVLRSHVSNVPNNAGISPKKRGPGRPKKYPVRSAAGSKQQNLQGSGSGIEVVKAGIEPVKAGIWYRSSHYEPVISPEWCNKLEKVFMALNMLMNVEEAIKNPPPCAIWLSSISSWP